MRKHLLASLVLLFLVSFSNAQTFSGIIKNKNTQNAIPFANVYLIDFEIGTISDSLGEFQFNITLPEKVKIRISNALYETQILSVETKIKNTFYLEESHIEFEEIVISSSKNEQVKNSVLPIEVRKIKDLKDIPGSNLGDLISNMPGVYNSSTGNGISKPVIRGLQGNRVVTYVNGLRIENQQFGGDHGMGINDLAINQVEVIKGPSSLQFGGDALGGVVFFSDDAYAKQNTQQISAQSQFESNTLGINNRIEYKISGKSLRFNLSALHANHADYQLSNGLFAGNSRFNEKNIKAALSYNRKQFISHLRYNYVANRIGIPGHTHDSIIDYNEFKYNYQSRKETIPAQVIGNHFISLENKLFLKRAELNLILGYTSNKLTEFEDKLTIPGIRMTLNNLLYHLRYKYNKSENLHFSAGIQGMKQINTNDPKALEFLTPNATSTDFGLYSIANYAYKKYNFQAGVRYDLRDLQSLQEFKGNKVIRENYSNVSFAIGGVRNSKKSTIRFNFSNGYRAPHFTELLSNGVHHGALRYEIGNQNLSTESAYQFDGEFEFHDEHISLSINPFYSIFNNFIYINPSDSLIEALPVYRYEQMKNAYISGVDLGLHYHPHFAHFLHLESTFSAISIVGSEKNKIAMIPQNRLNTFIKIAFKMKQKIRLEQLVLQHLYFFKQDQVSLYESKSKAYHLFNAALNLKVDSKNPFYIDFGFKNFLNEAYINHLSRLKNIQLTQAGFNFYLSLRYQFETKSKTSK
ncbi:MAG: TonB-dependent receptor domain-containing protein [Flavobacteriia bacterium]|jgi:iron complex outermembrane receptor protein